MDHQIKVMNRTANGIVCLCGECGVFQIEYKNLNFTFTSEGYDRFADYVEELKKNYRGKKRCKKAHKNIVIPTTSETLNIVLSIEELRELCVLLSLKDRSYQQLGLRDIQFEMCLN